MFRLKSISAYAVVSLLLLASVQQSFSEVIKIDIIQLAKEKVISIANLIFNSETKELEKHKVSTLNSTSNYVDTYLDDIKTTLSQYAAEETVNSKVKLQDKGKEITTLLEEEKANIVNQGKLEIKQKIDAETNLKIGELDNSLKIMIQEKFKP